MSINKYSPEMKSRAVAEWRAGVPFKEVMNKYNIKGTGMLSAWAKRLDAGKPLQTARQSKYAGPTHAPELKQKVLDAIASGMPVRKAAKVHGIAKTTVEHWKEQQKQPSARTANGKRYPLELK